MAERPPLDAQNPWPGLAAFTEGDHDFFRGREREADELARLVRRERLTVLFGRSGLGKSSLLGAGLFPRLRQDLHLPVYLRVGYAARATPRQQVWDALAAACARASLQAPPPEPDETLWAYFHRAGAGFWNPRRRPLLPVLVFDQFEELFTLGQLDAAGRVAAAAFVDELADLVENRPSEALRRQLDADPARSAGIDFERRGCKVLLSFREDFLAEMEGLRGRMPSLMRNRFRLLPMDGTQARAVVDAGGALVAPGVGERIIGLAWRNKAEAPAPEEADRIEVDPALLSVICSELNRRRQASGAAVIEAGLLDSAEREILVDFYERSMQGLDPGVRHFVEDELITAAGYRDSFAHDDALARPGVTAQALDSLVAARLLRLDERFGVRRLELTHDVLTRVVMDSRDRRREREAREQAERERAQAEHAAALAQARLRRSRRVSVAMGLLAVVSMAAIGLFADAFWWAKKNELPVDSMRTLQCFRTGYAPFPELVSIKAGEFDLGEQDPVEVRNKLSKKYSQVEIDEMYGIPDRAHRAKVRIETAYAMGQYEVTYDEYDYYVWRAHSEAREIDAQREPIKYPSTAIGGRGAKPVVNITLDEAQAYAEWLGRQTPGQRCSLPTEAEWEYAARAGTKTANWWGDGDATGWANFDPGIKGKHNGKAEPVGTYPENPWQLYDTSGNVNEMTCSAYVKEFDGQAERECELPSGRVAHVTRGGSFTTPADNLRTAMRIEFQQGLRRDYYGFRVRCDHPLPKTPTAHPCQPPKPASGPIPSGPIPIGRP